MSDLAFPLPPTTLPILGETPRYPVGRIFCVGRNYADHAREMGADPAREPPFFFMKPANAAWTGQSMPFPADTDNLHHEIELVVALGENARVFGYAVGVDLTKRDRQNAAKEAGHPWERAKAFERAAPLSAIQPAAAVANPGDLGLQLSVNGAMKQDSRTRFLVWSIPEILGRLGALWALQPGDIVFTGTPAGVSRLAPGDRVRAEIEAVGALEFTLR